MGQELRQGVGGAPHGTAERLTRAAALHTLRPTQAYQRPELWGAEEFRHMQASGHSMPATWSLLAPAGPQGGERVSGGSGNGSLQGGELWIHMPEASYPWQLVADCPAYVRCAAATAGLRRCTRRKLRWRRRLTLLSPLPLAPRSLAEAQAYCRLHGGRLMTEPEWELAAAAPDRGITQLCSGGWEWTASPFAPLPGEWLVCRAGAGAWLSASGCACAHTGLSRHSGTFLCRRLLPRPSLSRVCF